MIEKFSSITMDIFQTRIKIIVRETAEENQKEK